MIIFLGVDGIIAISMSLQCLSRMQILSFEDNELNDDGATALAQALGAMKELKRVSITWNPVIIWSWLGHTQSINIWYHVGNDVNRSMNQKLLFLVRGPSFLIC